MNPKYLTPNSKPSAANLRYLFRGFKFQVLFFRSSTCQIASQCFILYLYHSCILGEHFEWDHVIRNLILCKVNFAFYCLIKKNFWNYILVLFKNTFCFYLASFLSLRLSHCILIMLLEPVSWEPCCLATIWEHQIDAFLKRSVFCMHFFLSFQILSSQALLFVVYSFLDRQKTL